MKLGSAKKLTDPERGEGEERAGEAERGLGSTPGGRCKMAAAAPKRTRLLRRDPPATQASARPLVKSSSPDDEEEEEEAAAPVVRWSSSMLLGCLELVSPEDESREKKDGLSPAPGTSRRAARNPSVCQVMIASAASMCAKGERRGWRTLLPESFGGVPFAAA